MRNRVSCTIAALACLAGAVVAAQDPVIVTGCVAAVEGGYMLRNVLPADANAGHGARTTSSKASVPIMAASSFTTLRRTAGSNTSKGSTPISPAPVAPASSQARRSAGTNSSKASTPLVRRQQNPATYELEAEAPQISPYSGHVVEITGTPSVNGSAADPAPQKLKVKAVRPLLASCSS